MDAKNTKLRWDLDDLVLGFWGDGKGGKHGVFRASIDELAA